MTLALRWMGNLVDDEDRDRAARVWRWAGRRSIARDARPAVRLILPHDAAAARDTLPPGRSAAGVRNEEGA